MPEHKAIRLLILEDRPEDAELMLYELRCAGFEPEWKIVDEEKSYLAQLKTEPDLILADYNLPRFNAPRALALLAELGLDIPMIIVTGSISEEIAVDIIKKGAADYLIKDRMTRLGPAVARALLDQAQKDQKKKMERALRETEAKYRSLFENAVEGIYQTTPDGRYLTANPALARIYGYDSPFELITKVTNIEEMLYVDPESRSEFARMIHSSGIISDFESRVYRKDRSILWISENARAVKNAQGDILYYEGSVVDISTRKQAEQETAKHLNRIRALHQIDLAITSTLDLRAILDILLEQMEVFLPYSGATVQLYNPENGGIDPAACRNLPEEDWRAYCKTGPGDVSRLIFESKTAKAITNVQTDPRTQGNEFAPKHGLISWLGVPLLVKEEALGVLSVYTKVHHEFTDEEIEFLTTLGAQAAVAIHNSQLYQQTKKQALELEQSNKVKNEFLSIMSHELRTPLNVIMGYTGMMLEKMLGDINSQQAEALKKVMRYSTEFVGMISGILSATQIEANQMRFQRSEGNLVNLLEQLKQDYEISLSKELTLKWDYPDDLPPIRTDLDKLRHVLQNLINNAVKFTDQGYVMISAGFSPENRSVSITVADTGIGIAPEHLSIIFDKFRQVDSSETRLYGGTGLGLYIVKKFTELLGGQIDVESEVGKGSKFILRIPG